MQHRRLLRIIEGAILNTQHAHPEIKLGPQARHSIAKRAAGTLRAIGPDVLAPGGASDAPVLEWTKPDRRWRVKKQSQARRQGGGGLKPSPPWRARQRLSVLAGEARYAGDASRLNILIEVLRIIDEELKSPPESVDVESLQLQDE